MSNPTDPSVVPTVSASQKAEFHRKKATAAGAARTLEAVAEGSAKPVAMAKGAMETAAELGKATGYEAMAVSGAHAQGFPLKGAAQPLNPMTGTSLLEKGIMSEQLRCRSHGPNTMPWASEPSSMVRAPDLFGVQ